MGNIGLPWLNWRTCGVLLLIFALILKKKMDKVAQYKAIVQGIMQEIADMTPTDDFSETQLIMDSDHGHFVLFSIGWYNNKREY
ncbi:MAG: element excision factor XisI family protein, partial [Saprospiraceae bacterium]